MKKQLRKETKRVTPVFASETEEATWWYENRDRHSEELLAAVRDGAAQVLTKAKLQERIAAPPKSGGSRRGAADSGIGFG